MRFKKAGIVAFMAFLMTTQSVRAYGNEEVVISCTGPTFYEFNGYVVELPEGRVKALSGRNCWEENLVIDNRVKVIGWRAFDGNVSFKSVTIPNAVTLIEARAFSNTRFSSINIPISLVEIGDEAFASSYFGWRTKVVLPDSVKRIGDKAFWGSHLESISIPDDLVFLGKDAFVGSKLSSVEYCGNLTGFNVNNDRPLVIIEPTCSPERKAQFQARAKAKAEAEAKAKAEAEAKAKAEAEAEAEAKVAKKKTTITCVKGKKVKKVTAVKPKCPAGYKKK